MITIIIIIFFLLVVFGTANYWTGIWNIDSGSYISPTFISHTLDVTCMKLLSVKSLVTGSVDMKLYVWDISTATQVKIATFSDHTDAVYDVDKMLNGNVVSVGADKAVRIWNPSTGVAVLTKSSAHSSTIYCVKVLSDGTIATGGDIYDTAIKIWNVTLALVNTLTGHTNTIKTLDVLSSGLLISGSADGFSIVWNTANSTPVSKFLPLNGPSVTCIKELSDGAIAFAGNSPALNIFKLDMALNSQTLLSTSSSLLNGEFPCKAAMLYNSSLLVLASNGVNTEVVNVASSTNVSWVKKISLLTSSTNCLENLSN